MRIDHLAVVTVSTLFVAALAGCASDKTAQQAPAAQSASNSATSVKSSSTIATAPTPVSHRTAVAKPVSTSVYFDFDGAQIDGPSAGIVRAESDYLLQSSGPVELQGNADERGSRDYNMALGQKRADAVKRAMTAVGVKADRITTISYGEEKPRATGHDEKAWAENRRVDFSDNNK